MADIAMIFRFGLGGMAAMTLTELSQWRERARQRAKQQQA